MDVFEALADPTRREIVRTLSGGDRRAGELAEATGTTAPTVSKHLRVLLAAGLVEDHRVAEDARLRVFRLRPEGFEAVGAFLDQLQADWTVRLTGFKRHVEKGRKR
jgi:DNA-binding transcriptional ArsR family regulator